jgi:hypothetical protein
MALLIGRIITVLDPPYKWLLVLLHPVFWEHWWNCLLQCVMFSLRELQQPRRVI